MIINLLVMWDSWWRCWCCQDSVKLHWFSCRLRGSAYETQWVTSQQDHGDLEGGAPFSKVRKYLSACLLSTHRFAIWRYPDTGWWWRQRKQRPVKMNKSEQYWSWPADWFISFTRHYLHLIGTLTHFCRCDADGQNACTLLKMHQECISPWILVGFILLSLFWKHQPRSCISPMSSWSALTSGAGRSVKSSSADERNVCVDGARFRVHSQPFAMGKFLSPQGCPAPCCSMSWEQSCHFEQLSKFLLPAERTCEGWNSAKCLLLNRPNIFWGLFIKNKTTEREI